ncbi:MAG: hypothetical protein ABIX01_00460 [Chitinophagaceae bacterium]
MLSLVVHSQEITDAKSWKDLLLQSFDQTSIATQAIYNSLQARSKPVIREINGGLENDRTTLNDETALAKLNLLKSRLCRNDWSLFENKDWKYWGNNALKIATAFYTLSTRTHAPAIIFIISISTLTSQK